MVQATNLKQLSAVDPTSQARRLTKAGGIKQGGSAFKSNLEEHLSRSGAQSAARANLAALLAARAHPSVVQRGLPQGDKVPELQRPGRDVMAQMSSADYSPLTARVSASVNAASTIAGLKPWNQQWVFEGHPKPSAEVNPLFGKSNAQVALAQLQEALKHLKAEAAARGRIGATESAPGAGQVSKNLRAQTRGDVDVAAMQAAMRMNPEQRMHMAQSGEVAGNLAGQLHAMDGQMIEARTDGQSDRAQNAHGSGTDGLSGAEFMRTLSMLHPNTVGATSGGKSMRQDPGSGGFGSRPELKLVDGMKSGKQLREGEPLLNGSLLGTSAMLHSYQPGPRIQPQAPMMQVAGPVVPGEMAQNQLSHVAILGMTNGIRDMAPHGGGEMRIRLKPENLGELHLKVVSRGNEIGLQIQASSDKAKKILEDSMSSLKDSLAAHHLTLANLELSVGQSVAGHGAHNDSTGQQQAFSQPQNHQAALGQNAGDNRNPQSTPWNNPEGELGTGRPLKSAVAQSRVSSSSATGARVANGRLDVRA